MRALFLSLLALFGLPAGLRAGQVIFNEVMYHPAGTKSEYIEMVNLTSNRIDIAKWVVSGGVDYTFPDFNAAATTTHLLNEYERVIISSADPATTRANWPALPPTVRVFGPWVGSLNNGGEEIVLADAAGAVQTRLSYGDSGNWPMAADGAGHSLQIINPNGNVDDWRNWRASRATGGSPGTVEPVLAETPLTNPEKLDRAVLDFTSNWKYWRAPEDPDGADPEGSWFGVAFPGTGWQGPSPGFFGHDPNNAPLQALRGTSFTTDFVGSTVSYYFRTTFQWSGALTGQTFTVDQRVDDGVVYYLNGQELRAPVGPNLGRVRIPAGPTTHTTIASGTPSTGDAVEELNVLSGPLDGQLVNGTNVLCAEVHQNSTAGDDIYFGARFRIATPAPGGVVINEVRPAAVAGAGFVEFFNPTAAAVDLNGYYLSDTDTNLTKFRIAGTFTVPAVGYAVIGFAESSLGIGAPITVLLTQPDGATRQSGFGSGMVVDGRSAGRKPDAGSSWVLFAQPTPGAPNVTTPAPTVALSEVSFAAATGRAEWVEVFNSGTGPQALDGYFVSSVRELTNRVPLTGTLAAGSYASVVVDFTTDAGGSLTLYLSDRWNNILGTALVGRRTGLPSVQAWPPGAKEWYATTAPSRDAPNAPERQGDIVINEIMAKPPSEHDDGEFVELVNQGSNPVDLSGWTFTDGISHVFPEGTTLAAGQYLVLAKNPAWMTANYPGLTNVRGPFGGTLRNRGEQLRLEDGRGNLADVVDYKQGGQWPVGAGGEGSSLELMNPAMDNSQASSWRASDETTKSTFQPFSHTGTYRELRGTSPDTATARELLLNLTGDGYLILRNLRLVKSTAPTVNLITTGDAASHTGSGANGFHCTGTHCDSDSQPRAATPARFNALLTTEAGFHLISQAGGDTKVNLVQRDVTGIAANDVLTLSFEGRWVQGLPLMVAQTWDRSFGRVFRFPIPNNLGTPGAVNSRSRAVPAPTVDAMTHFPVVPTSSQPVVVTARVASATPLTAVSVIHRQDTVAGNGAWTTLAMNDGGTGGDALAGDGVWSATVPARINGAITQFYIRATAANGQENECPRQGVRRPGMWIVSNTPASTAPGILIQRNIISQYDRNALNALNGITATYDYDHPRMSNYGFNATMIFNETEALYNCELRRAGSPWTRASTSVLDRTRWKPPGDQPFRERDKSGVSNTSSPDLASGSRRFNNRLVRYLLHLFGYPVPDAEFIQQIVNTDAPRLGDEMEQTDSDFFDRAYEGGSDGELFEIDDAWYMYDTFDGNGNEGRTQFNGRWALTDWNASNASLGAVPSDESPIFYHGNWPVRFPEGRYDFAALSSFFRISNNSNTTVSAAQETAFRERMERMLDIDRAAIYTAVRGYASDWDNFTSDRGKNGFFYRRPTDGRFEFHQWDSDTAWDTGRLGQAVVGTVGGQGWTNLTGRPWFRQKVNYYLTSLIDLYTNSRSARMNAWLTAMNYQSANTNALAPFKTNVNNYPSFFATRTTNVLNSYININPSTGGTDSTIYSRATTLSTANNQTVANPVFTLAGQSSSKVRSVEITGHPEARFAWTPSAPNPGLWTFTNIALASGLNTLTVRAIRGDGTVDTTLTFLVTLTGNAPPIAALTSNPASGNVAAGETLQLDATASFDPEGSPLTFNWSILPPTGVSLTQPQPGRAEVRFTIPGTYTLTLQTADAVPQTVTLTRSFTVFNAADFASFGTGQLGPEFTLTNIEHRDNFSPSSWYSLSDVTGQIMVQVLDDSAKPLVPTAFTHPLIARDVPDSVDFVLQTGFLPDTREFGNWSAGLMLVMNEGGSTVRYTVAVEGGLNLVVRRSAVPAAYAALNTTAVTGSGAVLRVVRTGDALIFQNRVDTAWTTIFTQPLPAGSVAETGGVFVATSAATTVRVAFDYLLVADPSAVNNVINNLRITELHYRPAVGGVEFIELRNSGSQPINLTGVSFAQGQPFAMSGLVTTPYAFGNVDLNPGEFIVLTENRTLFRTLYGNGPRLAPEDWTSGSLSNSGERIVLLDASGNAVHDFSYGVTAPWPAAANGTGPSMEVVSVNGDYGQGTNWRAGAALGGSPGWLGVSADSDGDGVADEVEALFGTNPFQPGSIPAAVLTTNPDRTMTLQWPSVPGVAYRVETATTLSGWQIVQTFAGTGSWTFTPEPGQPLRFYRVKASPP